MEKFLPSSQSLSAPSEEWVKIPPVMLHSCCAVEAAHTVPLILTVRTQWGRGLPTGLDEELMQNCPSQGCENLCMKLAKKPLVLSKWVTTALNFHCHLSSHWMRFFVLFILLILQGKPSSYVPSAEWVIVHLIKHKIISVTDATVSKFLKMNINLATALKKRENVIKIAVLWFQILYDSYESLSDTTSLTSGYVWSAKQGIKWR